MLRGTSSETSSSSTNHSACACDGSPSDCRRQRSHDVGGDLQVIPSHVQQSITNACATIDCRPLTCTRASPVRRRARYRVRSPIRGHARNIDGAQSARINARHRSCSSNSIESIANNSLPTPAHPNLSRSMRPLGAGRGLIRWSIGASVAKAK